MWLCHTLEARRDGPCLYIASHASHGVDSSDAPDRGKGSQSGDGIFTNLFILLPPPGEAGG